EIMRPSFKLFKGTGLPKEVYNEALFRGEKHDQIVSYYFGEMRKLCEETGLMTRLGKWMWKKCGIYGVPSRYRSEPDRTAEFFA
ncbi:MAG: diiron oxygenase, partial [Solirubrobacterales bacterium]|nr:diiron oxygenase [Solirubrobacterales bacterium]